MLSAGLVVLLAANVREERNAGRLQRDLSSLRLETQKQIADLRESESAILEHDLLRINELSEMVQKKNEDELNQANSLASRTRAEMARIVEKRHQEMITAISDLRADLRSEAGVNAKTSHPAPVRPPVLGALDANVALAGATALQTDAPDDPVGKAISEKDAEATYAPPQKKGFWSHLNPFSRNKKKQESADVDSGQ